MENINLIDASFESVLPKKEGKYQRISIENVDVYAESFTIDSTTLVRDRRPFTVLNIDVNAGPNSIALPNSPYNVNMRQNTESCQGQFDHYKLLLQ